MNYPDPAIARVAAFLDASYRTTKPDSDELQTIKNGRRNLTLRRSDLNLLVQLAAKASRVTTDF